MSGKSLHRTSEAIIEVVVRRSPLLIEFRNAKTHQTINADERPMMYDARGAMCQKMSDPVSAPVGSYDPVARRFRFVVKPSLKMAPVTVADNGRARQVFLR